ncbi:MAG: SpoIIE family protein phosphatase, partial [Chlorobi bacterium]|nr:SpoIIE family protein phosphatase [Chlorobiota bacterium]
DFLHKEEYDTALIYFNKSLEYQKSAKNKQGQMKSLYKIALIYYLQNDLINAEKNALKSLELAQNTGYPLRITDASSLLADIYKKQNNWKKAYNMYELSVKMRDSIGNAKNQKITLKRQMQYEYEKQAAIDSITFAKELEIKNLQAKKSRTQRNYMFAGLIVLTIFLTFIFKNYKQKQEANILLEKQKQEIQTQADNLQKANEEISRKNKNITDSINYASRIQAALLPSQNLFGKFFSDYFIFYKPKDIVSGDFYYLKQIDDFLVYAVADCTGHGVPGAFVSLLGIAFLNEIIRKKEVQTAAQILEELRYEVKMSLNKNNAESRTNDGMDIALCIINTNTKKLQFAGAYNPLYIIRNEELTEIEADKMPAGIFIKEDKPFTNNEIQLKKGDRLYMFSDGYIDQCRVACTKKYSTKHFKELLLNISSKPMQEQKNILEKTLNEGSGNYKQIDDILVTGIKI